MTDTERTNTLAQEAVSRRLRLRRAADGPSLYTSGPLAQTAYGSCRLPGLSATLALTEAQDAYGLPFGIVSAPVTMHHTIVLDCSTDARIPTDVEELDEWTDLCAQWLTRLGPGEGPEAASLTAESGPDTLLSTRIALTYRLPEPSPRQRRTAPPKAVKIGARLPGLRASLQAAGAGVSTALCAREVMASVRIAYDPSVAVLIDPADPLSLAGLQWKAAAPNSWHDDWHHLRHDHAYSVSWAMTGMPHAHDETLMACLMNPVPDIARKRATLLFRSRAALASERDHPQEPKPSSGNLVHFATVLTATVTSADDLTVAHAAVQDLVGVPRISMRHVAGTQAGAFATALPLGVQAPVHFKLPRMHTVR